MIKKCGIKSNTTFRLYLCGYRFKIGKLQNAKVSHKFCFSKNFQMKFLGNPTLAPKNYIALIIWMISLLKKVCTVERPMTLLKMISSARISLLNKMFVSLMSLYSMGTLSTVDCLYRYPAKARLYLLYYVHLCLLVRPTAFEDQEWCSSDHLSRNGDKKELQRMRKLKT